MLERIVLCAVDDTLAGAWEAYCGEYPFVSVHRGSIFDAYADAIVSPANSFGFMDGGIDQLYRERWPHIESFVREHIVEFFGGELLVGQAAVIKTFDPRFKNLIVAPTMRVPMSLEANTINPYLAARAALCAAVRDGGIRSIAFPGLGTGVGGVPAAVCARQLRAAIESLRSTQWVPSSTKEAVEFHDELLRLPVIM